MKRSLMVFFVVAFIAILPACVSGSAPKYLYPAGSEALEKVAKSVDPIMLKNGYQVKELQPGMPCHINYYFREVYGRTEGKAVDFDLFTQKVAGVSLFLSGEKAVADVFLEKEWKLEYFGHEMPFGEIFDPEDYEDPGMVKEKDAPAKERDPKGYWSEVKKLNLLRESEDIRILAQFEMELSHAPAADGKRGDDTRWFKTSYEAWILKGDRLVLVGLNTAQNSFNEIGNVPELLNLPMEKQPFFEELAYLIDKVKGSSEVK